VTASAGPWPASRENMSKPFAATRWLEGACCCVIANPSPGSRCGPLSPAVVRRDPHRSPPRPQLHSGRTTVFVASVGRRVRSERRPPRVTRLGLGWSADRLRNGACRRATCWRAR
jgi:hypothetical protein